MESNTRKKLNDETANANVSKNSQSHSLKSDSTENEQIHRHSKLDKAILTFQLENIIIKLPHLTSFIVDLQIDDSKLIFSPKATNEENDFFIGYHLQKIVTARINNSHTRAKARKIVISVSFFNKDKKKIGSGKIDIHPGSFYGEEKLKLRPISIDLSTIEPCPLFFFGLQLNDIPTENPNNEEKKLEEINLPQLQNFELPDTLVSTKRRIAHRGSDAELMTDLEKEKVATREIKIEEEGNDNQNEEEENENDEDFFVINNPDLIEMINEEKRKKEEEEEKKKKEEIKRKQEEEEKKKQEEIKRKQEEEERRKQDEIKRKKEDERKKQEEIKRKIREEEKRKKEELKRKIEAVKKRQLEDLMQRSSPFGSNKETVSNKLKNKIKNKKNFANCISKNADLFKNIINAISQPKEQTGTNNESSLSLISTVKFRNFKRSLSTTPNKISKPSLIFPLQISKNFAFSYSYRFPTDENGDPIENAPFYPQNVDLSNIDIIKNWKKSAFKSIGSKSKTTDEVIDDEKKEQEMKIFNTFLSKLNDNKLKCDIKKHVESRILTLNSDATKVDDIVTIIAQANINNHNNNKHISHQNQSKEENHDKCDFSKKSTNKHQMHSAFLTDSFIDNAYNSYRNDTNRQALFLLSNYDESSISNSSSIITNNEFVIDEICAKQGDIDNDENGNFRTRYESLQRQAKIRFILAKMRRYSPQNRPQKLVLDNLIFHEWTVDVSSDDDDYEYYYDE